MKSAVVETNLSGSPEPSRRFTLGNWAASHSRRILPALGLFIIAPLVAEFLLGNMSVTKLGMLAILAPIYGGGALLIRECVRRTGRGWESILVLALAYGILEEAFLTETLFNPNYLGLNLHLLEPAFVPSLGISAWYTIFVLTLHTVWSISVSIALVEALIPERATSPWLGGFQSGLVAVIFIVAGASMASFSIRQDPNHFAASRSQFIWAAILFLGSIALAFRLPQRSKAFAREPVPEPWFIGLMVLIAASVFLLVPNTWGWWAVAAYLLLDALAVTAIFIWSGRSGWDGRHRLGLAGGAALAYAWHGFVQTPALGTVSTVTRIGNLAFAALAVSLIAAGARRTANFARQDQR